MAEPRNTTERAHDVLAAEEFAVPAPEALRHRGPVVLPEDPTGDPKPHDILAAEAFAGPAPGSLGARARRRGSDPRVLGLGALLLAVLLIRRRRR